MSTKSVPVAAAYSNFKGESWPRRASRPHREMDPGQSPPKLNSSASRRLSVCLSVCMSVLKSSGVPFQLSLSVRAIGFQVRSWHADRPNKTRGGNSQKVSSRDPSWTGTLIHVTATLARSGAVIVASIICTAAYVQSSALNGRANIHFYWCTALRPPSISMGRLPRER